MSAERPQDPSLETEIFGGWAAIEAAEYWVRCDLPEPFAARWTERVFDAIPVGVDLAPTLDDVIAKMLRNREHGLCVVDLRGGGSPALNAAERFRRRLRGAAVDRRTSEGALAHRGRVE